MKLVEKVYGPFLDMCMKFRYLTISLGVLVLVVIIGYVFSGRIGMILMPRAESDLSAVTAVLPYGCAFEKALEVRNTLVRSAEKVIAENGGDPCQSRADGEG